MWGESGGKERGVFGMFRLCVSFFWLVFGDSAGVVLGAGGTHKGEISVGVTGKISLVVTNPDGERAAFCFER